MKVLPCAFNQRQSHISIERGDGVSLELAPVEGMPGTYLDQQGAKVIRKNSTDPDSRIFETGGSVLKVSWTFPSAWAGPGGPFDQTLVFQGVSFRVACPNSSSINAVTIEAAGLELGPAVLEREADGVVTGAEVADLDGDLSPELYVYTTSAGSGSYGGLIAYSVNKRKSLSEIYLPSLEGAEGGYMGHDTFAVVDHSLVRRFPLYRAGDTNAEPGGGTRELRYRLVPGEAGWLLELDETVDD